MLWISGSATMIDVTDLQRDDSVNRSIIGRLLEELSWAGRSIREYRGGGVGYENVLVAEVMVALNFLPRTAFLGAVLAAASGADGTRAQAVAEVESADLLLLPPEIKLQPTKTSYQEQLVVQPDASLITPGVYAVLEAKRIRQGSFQEEQLAREFVAVMRDAESRKPLLLLLIPAAPPVPVAKLGRLAIEEAITARLDSVVSRTDGLTTNPDELRGRVEETVAWITWQQLRQAVRDARRDLRVEGASLDAAITRLCDFLDETIERHS